MKKRNILIIAIVLVQIQMYSQERTKLTFGGNAAYHIGTSSQKESISPLLFFKNGQSAGLDLMLIPKKGTTRYKLTVDYIMGTNDENAVTAYAKENKIPYDTFKFTKANPSGFSLMASPQFMLFPKSQNKKLPLMWLDLKAGVLINNQQNVEFFLGQTIPSKEIYTNSVSFAYNPTLIVNIIKIKKVLINLKAGYSNYGGFTFGVGIAEQNCQGMPCCKCSTCCYCNPCASDSENSINK